MKDRRPVDELSLAELEAALRVRRRQERLKRLGNKVGGAFDPLRTSEVAQPVGARGVVRPVTVTSRYSAVVESPRKRRWRPLRWRWMGNKILLLVELLALLGFIVLVAQLFTTVRFINEASRTEFATPTVAPTPMIGGGVLPGGHTPPDAQGRSEPVPIPAHLRSQVLEITPLLVLTPGPEQAQRVVIPSLGVDAPVVEGDDWEAMMKGVGHTIGSANPGARGNCVLSAHNDIYGEIFRDLPDLQVGDEILVHTQTQEYRYVVEQTRIVGPKEVSVLASTSTPVLTLITCYPYGIDTHRIVVIAGLRP